MLSDAVTSRRPLLLAIAGLAALNVGTVIRAEVSQRRRQANPSAKFEKNKCRSVATLIGRCWHMTPDKIKSYKINQNMSKQCKTYQNYILLHKARMHCCKLLCNTLGLSQLYHVWFFDVFPLLGWRRLCNQGRKQLPKLPLQRKLLSVGKKQQSRKNKQQLGASL